MRRFFILLIPLLLNIGCSTYVAESKPIHLDPRENGPDPSGLVWGYHPSELYVEFEPGLSEEEKDKLVAPYGSLTPRGAKDKEGFSENIYTLNLKSSLSSFVEMNNVKKIKGIIEVIKVRTVQWGFE